MDQPNKESLIRHVEEVLNEANWKRSVGRTQEQAFASSVFYVLEDCLRLVDHVSDEMASMEMDHHHAVSDLDVEISMLREAISEIRDLTNNINY